MRPLLLPAILAAATPAYAQAPALIDDPREIVVTATRVPTLAERIPAGITVIDRAAIEQRGYTTLADALAAVPGVRIVQSGGPGGNASVFIRGTESRHTLVLRDGLQINDPSDPGDAYNFGVDTLEDVERIEVVRGPMSGLYGSGAIGGVVNIITRKGEGAPRGVVTVAGGYPRAVLGGANLSGASGIWDYSASVESRSDQGFDATPRRLSFYTGERDGFRSSLATVNLGVTPVEGTRAFLSLRARTSKFGYDNVGVFDDPNLSGRTETLYGRAGVTSRLFGIWQTTLTAGRLQEDRRYTNLLDSADSSLSADDSRYHGRRHDLQWNNTVTLPDNAALTESTMTFGYQHLNDRATVRVNSSSIFGPFQQDVRAHSDSDAGYAGLQTTLAQRLTLSAHGRQETSTLTTDAFTWRVGGVLAVPEAWSRFHASYGTSFRAPSLFDRYGVDSFGFRGNPALRPERSTGYEFGVSTDLPLAGRADWATVSATYFDNKLRDLITFQSDPVTFDSTVVNVARARSSGVELALVLRPAAWLAADLSYTYTDTRNSETRARLLRRPLNAATAALRLTPIPGLTIVPELIYTGEFQDFLVAEPALLSGVGQSRGGLIFNLNVTYDVTPKVALYAYGRNLGNSRFEPANGFASPGASFLAGTRVRF